MLDKSASNLSQLNKSYGRSSTNSLGGQSIFASLDGTRSTKSTMGTQYNSHKASAPSFSFGSGPARIQFTGAAARGTQVLQASVASGDESPGPIYNPAPARKWLGDAAHAHFGTAQQRPASGGADLSKLTGMSMTPGPGNYPQPNAFGRQPLGRCSSEPEFSFGTQRQRENAAKATPSPGPVYEPRGTIRGAVERPAYSFGNEIRLKNRGDARTPGPGNYGLRGAMGTQVGSVYRSSSSACFGTPSAAGGGGRSVMTLEGRHSPGPIYMNQAACTRQELSWKRSAPRTAFTRAQRFPSGTGLTASSPGPGEYVI